MLSVNTNTSALNAQNKFLVTSRKLSTHFERLSSGLRINGAKDDAAGLSISSRMTAQVRGVQKAIQNANDNISFLQTAEGALNEVTSILQRMRELTVQASNDGVLNRSDRTSIQEEITQLSAELNRINETTTFNGRQIFSQHQTISTGTEHADVTGFDETYDMASAQSGSTAGEIATKMQQSWFRESVDRVEKYYGITPASGWDIVVGFTVGADFAGQVSGSGGKMTFNTDDVNIDDEGFSVAIHEVTHAVMIAAGVAGSRWWMEGTAQFMEDGDSRLKSEIEAADVATVVAATLEQSYFVTNGFDEFETDHYAAAYAATRYLHATIKDRGYEGGIKAMMQELQSNGGDFDAAIQTVAGFSSEANFLEAFQQVGKEFIENEIDLDNTDIGIIGGYDADKGRITTLENIVSHVAMFEEDKQGGVDLTMHIGPNGSDTLSMKIGSFNTGALNLTGEGRNVMNEVNTESLLINLDAAIDYVSSQRSQFGAMQNRLDSTIASLQVNLETTSASRSRIMDADFSTETASLATAQIIQQASVSVLAQANAAPNIALALLS